MSEQQNELVTAEMTEAGSAAVGHKVGVITCEIIYRAMAAVSSTAALSQPESQHEPDFRASIARVIKEESEAGAAVGWRPCTGCHETSEGYETGHYPYSKLFGCHVGSGCSECGGLGVTWEYWSKDHLEAMQRDFASPDAGESS